MAVTFFPLIASARTWPKKILWAPILVLLWCLAIEFPMNSEVICPWIKELLCPTPALPEREGAALGTVFSFLLIFLFFSPQITWIKGFSSILFFKLKLIPFICGYFIVIDFSKMLCLFLNGKR